MQRQYYVLNLCLLELTNCRLQLKEKQYLERQMIYIKNQLLDNNNAHGAENQSSFSDFEILYGMLKTICTEGAFDDELEQLVSQIHKIRNDLNQNY